MSIDSAFIMNSRMAGSIQPDRVPIGTPSRGVRPMEVSMHLPPFTAEMDEPLPRWHTMILRSSAGLPQSPLLLGNVAVEVPWNP